MLRTDEKLNEADNFCSLSRVEEVTEMIRHLALCKLADKMRRLELPTPSYCLRNCRSSAAAFDIGATISGNDRTELTIRSTGSLNSLDTFAIFVSGSTACADTDRIPEMDSSRRPEIQADSAISGSNGFLPNFRTKCSTPNNMART